jgi:lipid-binding SYLF domain-containing protein
MKNKINKIAVAFVMGLALTAFTAQAAEDLRSACQEALANFKNADPGIQSMIDNSAGYAVLPNVGKGGFIVGGARGKGLVFQNGQPIGQAIMTQGTVGAQIGGQSFAELIVFQDQTALNNFKAGKFEMSAGVSAVAAQEGASKVAKYNQGAAVFTLARKGLMAEASVGGQKFKFEPTITR